jgi:hypothetical protein
VIGTEKYFSTSGDAIVSLASSPSAERQPFSSMIFSLL